jgi:hypothetical protein
MLLKVGSDFQEMYDFNYLTPLGGGGTGAEMQSSSPASQ